MSRFVVAMVLLLCPLFAQNDVEKATDQLQRGELKKAQAAFEGIEASLLKSRDPGAAPWLNLTRCRLAEVMGKRANQLAKQAKDDAEAIKLLEKAERKFAEVAKGPDCSTAREGTSLHAEALRQRVLIHVRLWATYKEMAKLNSADLWSDKRDEHRTLGEKLYEQIRDDFPTATTANAERVEEATLKEARRYWDIPPPPAKRKPATPKPRPSPLPEWKFLIEGGKG